MSAEKCPYCGFIVTDPCESVPPDICEKAADKANEEFAPMTIDDHGIIRDPSGAKVAVFKDPSLGQCLIDRAGLLSADEASELTKVAVGAGIKLNIRRVIMWEVVNGH